ncbi:MAG: hypothetical protein ABIG44_08270 [Planctomycetota bacterium]
MSICSHKWSMSNIRGGYLVVEGCRHCQARASFFSTESTPPVDDYHEGKHYWTYLGSFQAIQFDLACDHCDEIIDLGAMVGLMLSTCSNPECEVSRLAAREGRGTWVYVALCADSTHATGQCVGEAEVTALAEYFNANIKAANKKVIVVPCIKCCNIDTCAGIVIADTGLTEIY